MTEQLNDSAADETAPLLPNTRGEDDGQAAGRTLGNDPWQRSFILMTAASIVSGSLTIVLLLASVIVMSGKPVNYWPPIDIYYYFAPIAGLSIIAILHSTTTLLATKNGVPPQQGFSGILVDIFAGLYFLFQSLYSMQQLLYRSHNCSPPYGPNPNPEPDPDCEAWRRSAEPLFWVYLFVTLVFGVVHAVLLFLRAARFRRSPQKVLLVRLVREDGTPVQPS